MKLTKGAKLILEKINSSGYEAYVVGGAVRNYFLNLPADDFDFTTSALPEEVLKIFEGYNTFAPGLKHGTVCVEIDGSVYEITTFRHEEGYEDNRHPKKVRFVRNLSSDLARRDFTINAICYDGEKFVDLFGGQEDIKNKIIRAIGNPEERFEEDALRILRAIRFSSRLGFRLEQQTKNAIFARKRLLNCISAERIREEFNGILLGANCKGVLLEFRDVIKEFIPEISASFDFEQKSPYHSYDVYTHAVEATANVKPTIELRLSAFLHDVAKPLCYSEDESGRGHFYGHDAKSATIAGDILRRLKYPTSTIDEVVKIIKNHSYPIQFDEEKPLLRALSRFGEQTLRNIIEIKKADNLAKTPAVAKERIPKLNMLSSMLNDILQREPCFTLKQLAVDGNDIMALGVSGVAIGQMLAFLLDAVLSGEQNKKEVLIELAKRKLKE